MPSIRWRHHRKSLLLPVAILPGLHSDNPSESIRVHALLDTGATGTGIRRDVAERLALRPKGQRRVNTANGMLWATEYVIRIGFIIGDYEDSTFMPDTQQPYVFDGELIGFELQPGFSHAVLLEWM